ncbi:Protein of unknown function DUF3468 [Penicillium expansum]|uniref:Zn(2)-C6 fungal-type domain-containing protein n=1 Tax=Penicillium expansum TaxID=27334 RepID=A0A0A2JWV5_PENEN|nr:Protein of unknown function DUF3468 [Penicillium expansum]KGO48168.1 Protein of unknown function DUF3468 [Penicillium expansum]KGO59962.1 Protein of unknown function DUF3468 [Penicillium expansum]
MKCDEIKPICGPCAKKDKICDYTNLNQHSLDSSATNKVVPENLPILSTVQPIPPLEQNNNHLSSDHNAGQVNYQLHGASDHARTVSEADLNPSPPAMLEYRLENEHIPSHSPGGMHGDYLSPSTTSLAAVRWLGLLASGFPSDGPQLSTLSDTWESQSLSLGYRGGDVPTQTSSLQRATQVLDGPPGRSASQDVTDDRFTESTTMTERQVWQSREPIDLLPTEQTLFEHFVHQVSPLVGHCTIPLTGVPSPDNIPSQIDLFDPTNKFSTLVVHLALHNAGLLNAILALSFRHLALNPSLDDQSITSKPEEALQYYYQTLHYVGRAMQSSAYKMSLELLSTALIISTYEMLDNSTDDWERHLEGVFLIQRSQTIHGETGGLKSAVWWAWLCQDIWAAFREKRKTLTFWVPQKPLSVLLPHELAARSIYIAAKVVSYCAAETTQENIQHQIDEAMRLRIMLEDWQRHLTVEFSPLPIRSREASSCFQPVWISPPAFVHPA